MTDKEILKRLHAIDEDDDVNDMSSFEVDFLEGVFQQEKRGWRSLTAKQVEIAEQIIERYER